jgi:hypothetical protein
VKELHDAGYLRKNSAGKGNYYWPHEDVAPGVCPKCHGILSRDKEQEYAFNCMNCGAGLMQFYDEEEPTKFGRTYFRGLKAQAWWMRLPDQAQSFVATIVTVFMDMDTPEGVDFRPENLTFPGDPAKNASAREDDAAE